MSRPNDPSKYPPQFFKLAARFEKDPETQIRIPMDAGQAHSLQLQLQSFRTALRRTNDITRFPNFDKAEIGRGPNNASVIISLKDRTLNAQAVDKALDDLDRGEVLPET